MKKLNLILTAISIIAITTYSCKKDRIEAPEEPEQLNAYTPVNTYLDTKKQQEQEFIITGPSNDTITGNHSIYTLMIQNIMSQGGFAHRGGTLIFLWGNPFFVWIGAYCKIRCWDDQYHIFGGIFLKRLISMSKRAV